MHPSEQPDPKNSAAAVLKVMPITKSQLIVLDEVCDDIYWWLTPERSCSAAALNTDPASEA